MISLEIWIEAEHKHVLDLFLPKRYLSQNSLLVGMDSSAGDVFFLVSLNGRHQPDTGSTVCYPALQLLAPDRMHLPGSETANWCIQLSVHQNRFLLHLQRLSRLIIIFICKTNNTVKIKDNCCIFHCFSPLYMYIQL